MGGRVNDEENTINKDNLYGRDPEADNRKTTAVQKRIQLENQQRRINWERLESKVTSKKGKQLLAEHKPQLEMFEESVIPSKWQSTKHEELLGKLEKENMKL